MSDTAKSSARVTQMSLRASACGVFDDRACVALTNVADHVEFDEAQALARLFAAAPDLYEALKLVKERRRADFTMTEWRQIDAALAKALGAENA